MRISAALAALALVAGCCKECEKAACASAAETYGLETCRLFKPSNVEKPVFSWKMKSARKGAKQAAYKVKVTCSKDASKVLWDSGEVASDISVGVKYAGTPLKSGCKYNWSVEVKDDTGAWLKPATSWFESGLMEPGEWAKAKFIGVAKPMPKATGTAADCDTSIFGWTLVNEKDVMQVYWFTTGLGVYEAFANGEMITHLCDDGYQVKDFLKPGFTHALKCRHYYGYDITHQCKTKAGEKNVFAALATQGWWRDQPNGRRGKESAFAGVMIVRYADGTEKRFYTDDAWVGDYDGAFRVSGIFLGEIQDARVSMDWMKTGDFPKNFAKVKYNDEFKGEIRPLQGSPIRLRIEDLKIAPVEIYVYDGVEGATTNQFGKVKKVRSYKDGDKMVLKPGETMIVDFGQNCAGKPNFTFSAARGTEMTVNVAEMLNDDMGKHSRKCDGPEGSLYRANYRGAPTEGKFIFKGEGDELFHPKFTFFGFRYIAVKVTAETTIADVKSVPMSSVQPWMETGKLVTSDESLNRLIKNGVWGMYSNYLSVPTDCPQRDERLGWAADTQVFAKTGCYNADVYGFLSKWMADMRDSQHDDGGFPGVAPLAQYGNNGGALGWADAGIIVPHVLWRMFGDVTVLEENWDAMVKFLDYVEKNKGPNPEPWGEWLAYERNDRAIKEYLAAAFGVWDAMMMQDMAKALGKDDAAAHYAAFEKEQRAFFASKFLTADGTIDPKYAGQAADVYAIYLDLVTGDAFKKTVEDLCANIKRHGDKLQTGFLGTAVIQDALVKGGRADIAYTILLQRGNPSWLYSIDQGATTFWERWNSYTKESGFGDAGMNSFNHYAYGAVVAWMYGAMAGILEDVAAPGFKHFFLAPHPDKRVGSVAAEYDSAYGLVKSAWAFDGAKWSWDFTIPANTTATVVNPVTGEKAEYASGAYSLAGEIK